MFISKMKTLWSVCTIFFLFGFVLIKAVTDEEFDDLLSRLTVLEEKQVISDKRIGSLEQAIVSYEKRIVDLETYRKLSDGRIAKLKRKVQYSNKLLITLEKKLSDKTFAVHEKGKTPSENAKELFGTGMSGIIFKLLRKNDILHMDKNGQDVRKVTATDTKILTTDVYPGENRRFIAKGNVAFSAMKSAEQDNMGINQNIIFEQVLSNEGDGYNPIQGVFIAPQSGFYVLSSTVMTSANDIVRTAIVYNGNIVARIFGHGDNGFYDQGSQTIVIKLNADDEVAVQNIEFPNTGIAGALYSSFSGYLLWPQ